MAFLTMRAKAEFSTVAERVEELCAQLDRLTWHIQEHAPAVSVKIREKAKAIEMAVAEMREMAAK